MRHDPGVVLTGEFKVCLKIAVVAAEAPGDVAVAEHAVEGVGMPGGEEVAAVCEFVDGVEVGEVPALDSKWSVSNVWSSFATAMTVSGEAALRVPSRCSVAQVSPQS